MRTRQRTKGISLAKGPVGLVGLVLLAYGITALIFGGHSFVQHALSGEVHGKRWLGLEVNGWSGLLFIGAGLLLLLGAPIHWSAKGMSLIVGIALGALAVIALVNGHGALGIFAANHLTELVWGAAAVVLIVFSLLPRVGGKTTRRDDHRRGERSPATRRVEPEPTGSQTGGAERQSPAVNAAGSDTRVTSGTGAHRGRDDPRASNRGESQPSDSTTTA
jgi:hypothetical protein